MRHWPPHTDLVREDPKGGGGGRSDPVRSGSEGGRLVRCGPDPSPVGRRLPGADEDVAPPIGVRLTSWGQRCLRARRGGVSLASYHDREQRLNANAAARRRRALNYAQCDQLVDQLPRARFVDLGTQCATDLAIARASA